ncbi:hypothetical protein C8R44DRAFT_859306 [Mycena epipterygia]|nr:hypothetical protein C8R44DRAFT_859306 [Mycena epipterygia]
MQQEKGPPLPPLPAFQGLACYKCFKEDDVLPSRCSGCHRISYCSPECQKVDWKMHKPMCKALSAIEKINPIAAAKLLSSLPSEPITNVEVLNRMAAVQISSILDFCQRSLQRQITLFEENLVIFEPRCMVCRAPDPAAQCSARTDQLIRMEAAITGTTTDNSRHLIPCPQCNLCFCCSPAHWEAARALHHGPCEDADHGHDGLSQCEMNSEVRAHIKFEAILADKNGHFARFRWAPPRVKSAWMSLTALSWEGEFDDEIRAFMGFPASFPVAPFIRAASDDLTMAMAILYGLEKLNDDDGWTRRHTLTVHIIGANLIEVSCGMVFEEILHRLPEVKILKLVLCRRRLSPRPRHSPFRPTANPIAPRRAPTALHTARPAVAISLHTARPP